MATFDVNDPEYQDYMKGQKERDRQQREERARQNGHKPYEDGYKGEESKEEIDTRLVDRRGHMVFRTTRISEILASPDISWLVYKMFQAISIAIVYCPTGIGKSFFALHLALCVAGGLNFFGRRTKPGVVLYIYAEGRAGLKQRIQAWKQKYGEAAREDLEDRIEFIAYPIHLLKDASILEDLIAVIEEEKGPISLLIVDTWGACSVGMNRSDPTAVTESLVTAIKMVAEERTHFCVLLTHHTNKPGKDFSGSQAFEDNVTTMISLEQNDKDGPITAQNVKQRDGETFADFTFERVVVKVGTDEYGEPITSCYLTLSDEPTAKRQAIGEKAAIKEAIYNLLWGHGDPMYRAQWMEAVKARYGVSKRTFDNCLETLVKEKKVIPFEKKGQGNKQFYEVGMNERTRQLAARVKGVLGSKSSN